MQHLVVILVVYETDSLGCAWVRRHGFLKSYPVASKTGLEFGVQHPTSITDTRFTSSLEKCAESDRHVDLLVAEIVGDGIDTVRNNFFFFFF